MVKQTRILMGMPITVEVVDEFATDSDLNAIFDYFTYVDEKFSTYKATSEISRINAGQLDLADASEDMQTVFKLSAQTRWESDGFFDIKRNGAYDPSGLVKGWAIYNASEQLRQRGFQHYFVDAGGDIQTAGKNAQGKTWRVGIRNPFNIQQIVKVVYISDRGIATSGSYIRGQHIYNPKSTEPFVSDVVSLTVIGPNIYEADRFATAAFAMGRAGIDFIENLNGFEGYMIDENGWATFTTGFGRYTRDA